TRAGTPARPTQFVQSSWSKGHKTKSLWRQRRRHSIFPLPGLGRAGGWHGPCYPLSAIKVNDKSFISPSTEAVAAPCVGVRRPPPHPFCQGARAMSKFVTAVKKFFRKGEEGASLAEYGLLLALIAVVCIAAITTLGTKISSMFSTLAGAI